MANFSLGVNGSELLPPYIPPYQCQIIRPTFFILKTDNIAKLRTELKSILLELPSNKIKGTYIKLVIL